MHKKQPFWCQSGCFDLDSSVLLCHMVERILAPLFSLAKFLGKSQGPVADAKLRIRGPGISYDLPGNFGGGDNRTRTIICQLFFALWRYVQCCPIHPDKHAKSCVLVAQGAIYLKNIDFQRAQELRAKTSKSNKKAGSALKKESTACLFVI